MSFKITHTPSENPATLAITLDQVDKLYLGKGNNCRCGCAGAYHEPASNPKLVTKYLAMMASGEYKVESQDGYIFEIELSRTTRSTKVATLYLKETPKA